MSSTPVEVNSVKYVPEVPWSHRKTLATSIGDVVSLLERIDRSENVTVHRAEPESGPHHQEAIVSTSLFD